MSSNTISGNNNNNNIVTTIIFDVDDTLYDVGTGFTANRNGIGAQKFMVEYLNFPNYETAKIIRDEYFEKYHATAKALQVAEKEGKFPKLENDNNNDKTPRFDPKDLAEYWATNLQFDLLGGPKSDEFIKSLQDLKSNVALVAFSNGPRKYVIRVLNELGLWDDNIFTDENLFAVDDVLPYCKPERKAFELILDRIGIMSSSTSSTLHQCVMIEDSMKNIRKAKELGMKTVLITGKKQNLQNGINNVETAANLSLETKPGDAPIHDDPAVDVAIETIEELQQVLPGLWNNPPIFEPQSMK